MVRDGVSKISEYIDHRNAREKQVVSALESKPAGASPMQLVATIYAKVRGSNIHPLLPSSPLTLTLSFGASTHQDNLPPTLQVAAARSVALHCGKVHTSALPSCSTVALCADTGALSPCHQLLSEGRVTIGGSETKVGVDTVMTQIGLRSL